MKYFASWLVFVIPTAETAHPVFFTQEGLFLMQKLLAKLHVWDSKLLEIHFFPD